MDEAVRYWVDLAEYDLGTADAMLRTGRYLYVGFMCHQTVEKDLKAWYQAARGELPPRTHNLRLLLQAIGAEKEVRAEDRRLIAELEPLNVETRYPENRARLEKALTRRKCDELVRRTAGFHTWIKSKL
ncbi:HEPN domain-containing protein [Deferrisoma camini]|uniref:HEPN domain-containing protein n=1 Tax=Deferrisoma camini TaxID=1035120 RepID=UPI00046D4B9A|nr:HEPN domain-containing protein [Deferrisoma camini]